MTNKILQWTIQFKKKIMKKYIQKIEDFKKEVVQLDKEIKELEKSLNTLETKYNL
jgi:predicted RNase H-like nuclease (RuvC/YqgF family)